MVKPAGREAAVPSLAGRGQRASEGWRGRAATRARGRAHLPQAEPVPPGCTTGTRDVDSGSRWAWSAPASGGKDGWTAGRADTCGTARAGRRRDPETVARIPVRGKRGVGTEGGGGGRAEAGKAGQARGLETGAPERALWEGGEGWTARNEVQAPEGPRLGTQSARRTPRGWGQRREAALGAEGTRGPVPGSGQSPPPTSTPPAPPPDLLSTSPSHLRRLGSAAARAWGPQNAPSSVRPCPRGPHLGLGGSAPRDAEPGGIRRAPPRGRGAGPPLAGRGDRRRGGCHAGRALANLGLKATPSGGGGSSRALRRPARGGVCRRSPPPLPELPPPTRGRPAPTPRDAGLTPRPAAPGAPAFAAT